MRAQLNTTFEDLFDEILDVLVTEVPFDGSLDSAAARANALLTPTLNNLIASNVASFPLTSTLPGKYPRFVEGVPEIIWEGMGPIFAETAETLEWKKISVGVNYSFYDLSSFRGFPTDQFRFTLTSDDLNNSGALGDVIFETETVDVYPNLNLSAETYVLYLTYGVLNSLNVSLAVPVITLRLEGTARAVINSTTFYDRGGAIYRFDSDPLNPVLDRTLRYAESTTGLGDLALRVKYAINQDRQAALNVAMLLGIRLPTGNKEDFLGTGEPNARLAVILSRQLGDFFPHLNLGYEYRGADFDSNEIEFNVGFSQKIHNVVTFALEVIGQYDVATDKLTAELVETRTLDVELEKPLAPIARTRIDVPLSNLPRRRRDNVLDLSVGFKIAPLARGSLDPDTKYRFSLLANVFVPLQNGGMRSRVTPTFGLAMNF